MTVPRQVSAWRDRADIDYIGPFVKAWAAFNAWYRHESRETKERAMLEYVKSHPNPIRRTTLPLLSGTNTTADALAIGQAICDLHRCLDGIQLEVRRRNRNERISFRSVCIKRRDGRESKENRYRQEFIARIVRGGSIEISVTSLQTGRVHFSHTQSEYDANALYSLPSFAASLSESQRATLRQVYDGCNPRPMQDLVRGEGPELAVGPMQFRCHPEELFAGVIETIYAMRNALLHGETDPDVQVLACYEPAYRIVMHFLAGIK